MSSFYTREELEALGFASIGRDVLISRYTSIYGAGSIHIGDNVRIDDFCILSGHIKLGSHIHIAAGCYLFGMGEIEMHDFSGLSSRVALYSATDDFFGRGLSIPNVPIQYRAPQYGRIVLRPYSVIGTGTTVLPDSVLEEGAAVGAMSLVKGVVPANCIYSGIPATYKRDRLKEYIEQGKRFKEEYDAQV